MSPDWVAVLDELELSILDGSEFVAPKGQVPAEHAERLAALLELCSQRIAEVSDERSATGEELSRLVSVRGNTRVSGHQPQAAVFNARI